ncbi:hypothetical protein M9M90_04615 [Phenylobacterium sp. LH3H17]|uniref:hypothetical protein n=1 Tax=Phenylobacterium sp. LH3H17 TaxID=2903901 RepID=UPI0020C9EECE|nr:hypothetical protein [Phenylobacterium sp. LH3H17]UTP40469.1 hypothetical protein M9M90_04615 [Phenylobacterium sp. LH3H17]
MLIRQFQALALCLALAGCGRLVIDENYNTPEPVHLKFLAWYAAERPYPEATEVRLHVDNDSYDKDSNRIERPETVRVLSVAERAQFERALQRVRVVGLAPPGYNAPLGPACFVPHHFFKYYDAAGKQVGEILVCFCCLQAQAQPAMAYEDGHRQWLSVHVGKVRDLVKQMGLPTQQQCE